MVAQSMKISIIELFNKGKTGNPEICEDLFVANDNFVAVIDGATNISSRLIRGKAPGRIAAEVIRASILEATEDIELPALIAGINKNLRILYEEIGILDEILGHPWMAPTACLICYSHYYQEIWQIGDSQCMIDEQLYTNEKIVDDITANARALYLESELKNGKTIENLLEHDPSWDYIRTLIKHQYYLQNDKDNQFGFEVINGFDLDFSRVKIIKVPEGTRTIILASDGYPILKTTLTETEDELQHLLQTDPLCFRQYKSAKGLQKGHLSFDDRTYIRFEIQN